MTGLVQPGFINVDYSLSFMKVFHELQSKLLPKHQVLVRVGLRSELLGLDEAQLDVLLHDLTNLELIDP